MPHQQGSTSTSTDANGTHRPAYRTSQTAVALTVLPRRTTSSSTITELGWTPSPSVPLPIALDAPSYSSPRKESSSASAAHDAYRPAPPIGASALKSSRKVQITTNGAGVTTPKKSLKNKGKGKATAFVVGAPSSGSGDEGDVDTGTAKGEHEAEPDTGLARLDGDVSFGESSADEDEAKVKEMSVEEIIRWQIRQPPQSADSLDLDSCLPLGIGDYTFVLNGKSKSPSPPPSSPHPSTNGKSSPLPERPNRVSLGKGKFSEVLLARKGNIDYALKHTPLHPHHPLIATRLLREPTILAQLLPHPNLVKVFETIRTPGHFYLVEENLADSITLESLVASQPGQILSTELAWSVLDQLSSVVRSLHEPLRVCHRDIKPENILVKVTPSDEPNKPPTLLLKLLDFGLATHYSSSEAKLTTCCGSPAYHSPELWRSLREPSGTVKYWGPEVDIWCLGLTLLRCLTPNKYPLGIAHSSIFALSDKVVDSLLAVRDEPLRRVLAALLQMDGEKRMRAFEKFCAQRETVKSAEKQKEREQNGEEGDVIEAAEALLEQQSKKEFKSTTFIPTERLYSLHLPVCTSSSSLRAASRSVSRSRLQHHHPELAPPPVMAELSSPSSPGPSSPDLSQDDSAPQPRPSRLTRKQSFTSPIEIVLLNPTDEPIRRSASYIKYALRCAGILYHVRDNLLDSAFSLASGEGTNSPISGEDDSTFVCQLQCVIKLPAASEPHPSKASSALIAALRPPITRANTTGSPVRSSSTPPGGRASQPKKEEVKVLTFFLSIRKAADGEHDHYPPPIPVHQHHAHPPLPRQQSSSRKPGESQSRRRGDSQSRKTRAKRRGGDRIVITLSDDRALSAVRDALKIDTPASPTSPLADGDDRRGRTGRTNSHHHATANPESSHKPLPPAHTRTASGSRDAANRRHRHHSHPHTPHPLQGAPYVNGSDVDESAGLGLKLAEEKRPAEGAAPVGGFFDFVTKLPGLGSRQNSLLAESEPTTPSPITPSPTNESEEDVKAAASARDMAMAAVAF